VEKSPTRSTLAFLCKFGSAWNSRVTRFSTSLGVEAYTKVRPLIWVSAVATPFASAPAVPTCAICWPWRMTKVKVKASSSSLFSLRMKLGGAAGEELDDSVSWTDNKTHTSATPAAEGRQRDQPVRLGTRTDGDGPEHILWGSCRRQTALRILCSQEMHWERC